MKSISSVLLATSLALSGCAHDVMRGSIAMKVNDQEGHVCLGKNEVKAGDRVALYNSECSPGTNTKYSSAYEPPCRKVKIGEGQITQILNEHYSVVKADAGTVLKEGTIAEKIR